MRIDELTQTIIVLTEMARNGAVITGNSTNATKFRERSLEQIFSLLARDIVPHMREKNIVNDNEIWEALSSIECLEWKTVIRGVK